MLAHITNTSALAGMERVRMEESCPAKGGGGASDGPLRSAEHKRRPDTSSFSEEA